MAEAIKICDPDIVGLNEMRGADPESDFVNQVEELARLAGYEYFYFSKACDIEDDDGPFGNGVLSKYPLSKIPSLKLKIESTSCFSLQSYKKSRYSLLYFNSFIFVKV